jgi:hypothetical protein
MVAGGMSARIKRRSHEGSSALPVCPREPTSPGMLGGSQNDQKATASLAPKVPKADMPGANDLRAVEGCLPLRNRAWGPLAGAQPGGYVRPQRLRNI